MSDQPTNLARRHFVSQLGVAAGAATLGGMLCQDANAADLPLVSETDSLAMAMNYKADTTKVDAKKFPAHKASQTCDTCQFFQGPPGANGPCQIFPGKSVAAKGWCQVWTKKA
jgi:hypothetical protein